MTIAGADALGELEKLASGLLRKASPGERRTALRRVAKDVQKSQRSRIGRQRNSDGTPFAPRRKTADGKPGNYPLRFLYPKGDDQPKLVVLPSWERQGPRIVGFDAISKERRSYRWDRIARFLPPDGKRGTSTGRLRRKGSIRAKAMFRKLKLASYLRAGSTPDEAWVGFSGRAAAIARVHQEGREDSPRKGGKKVRYPRREILGLTEADRRMILDSLLAHVAPA